MPSLFEILGYRVYFWSNENNEPIHVHVSKGRPSENGTKFWLTQGGTCILAHNKAQIPNHDINELQMLIAAQYFYICAQWKDFFEVDDIRFYC